MRDFLNLDKQKQFDLSQQYPGLYKLCDHDVEGYEPLAISIFTHCLSIDEAYELLSYVKPEEQIRRNNLLSSFNLALAERVTVYNFRFRGKHNNSTALFRTFQTEDSKSKYLTQTSNARFHVIIPELDAVYFEGYDDTNIFYFKSSEKSKIILSLAKNMGLHCW